MVKVAYQFIMPCNMAASANILELAINKIGKIKKHDTTTNSIKFHMIFPSATYVLNYNAWDNESTLIRILAPGYDKQFDKFIKALSELVPNIGIVPGKPYIIKAQYVGGSIMQTSTGTTQGASIGGALIGGALFGGAGAIVGSMSGNKRSQSSSKESFSNYSLFLIQYSNGKITEEKVKKNSKLYNEIMTKLVDKI